MLSCRSENSLVPVRSVLPFVYISREILIDAVSKTEFRGGNHNRQTIFADTLSILLRGIRKVSSGRHPQGRRRNGAVYGRHLHRPDTARASGLFTLRADPIRRRYMVRLAHRLDNCHDAFRFLLS